MNTELCRDITLGLSETNTWLKTFIHWLKSLYQPSSHKVCFFFTEANSEKLSIMLNHLMCLALL